LASAGLLDGRRATTHWSYAERLARSFPSAHVESDRIFVRDGHICYGWHRLGVGADRSGLWHGIGLEQSLETLWCHSGANPNIPRCFRWTHCPIALQNTHFAQAHLAEDLTVERLASIASLSPRQFARAFHEATGETPATVIE